MVEIEEKILNAIIVDDLSEEMRYLTEFIGFDNVKTMMKICGGSRLSVPMPESYKMIVLERHVAKIDKKLDSFTIRRLAREYGVNVNVIYKFLKNSDNGKD